ncbi:GNAT family N-acetyltransferase [Desulfogranum mediterraneum]|uniref:GNAT family N-acetyltransferase n=1 Tax=Desulfogranum mediterraneum TaxID=160661 RepID=UPI0006887B79|nr:GNAT family N-acetyltransferase [Desulfogranum mediterraneum]
MANLQRNISSPSTLAAGVLIRPAQAEDLPRLLPLLEQLFSLEKDFCFAPLLQERGLRLLLETPAAALMVAAAPLAGVTDRSEPVGMVSAQLVISTAEGGPALLVEDLVVAPDWQKKGIGRQLLAGVADWGREQGARRLQLLADKDNQPGLAFYSRNRWSRTALICLRTYI